MSGKKLILPIYTLIKIKRYTIVCKNVAEIAKLIEMAKLMSTNISHIERGDGKKEIGNYNNPKVLPYVHWCEES